MKVRVLLFAQLRDAAGSGELILDLNRRATVREASREIFSRNNFIPYQSLPLLYAVNEDFASPETQLGEGDVLALLPPVAGG